MKLPVPKQLIPVVSVVCALTCLSGLAARRLPVSGHLDGDAVHRDAMRHGGGDGTWVRSSAHLSEMLRIAERRPAWRLTPGIADQDGTPALTRNPERRPPGWRCAPSRHMLRRASAAHRGDDPPA